MSRVAQATQLAIADMQVIHRSNDGFIVFCSKDGDKWTDGVCAIQANELEQFFPQFVEELWAASSGSYFTVNSMEQPFPSWKPGMGGARKNTKVRWLTAAYADLDCYGLPWDQALGVVARAQDKEIIPKVSIIARSGRGAWLFWLLRSSDGHGPIKASDATRPQYQRVQAGLVRSIAEHLPELGVDLGAKDLARVTRIPHSSHPSGTVVEYHVLADPGPEGGLKPRLYTLEEFEASLNLPPVDPPKRFIPPRAHSTGKPPKRVSGHLAIHTRIVNELEMLATARDGIREGQRDWATMICAYFTSRSGCTWQEAQQSAYRFARDRCHPPLSNDEIRDSVQGARGLWKQNPPRYRTIAEWVGVTAGEADAIGLQYIRPDFIPQAHREKPQKVRARLRREALIEIIDASGQDYGLKELRAALTERGLGAAEATVWRDLAAIGHQTPAQRHKAELHAHRTMIQAETERQAKLIN